MMCAACNDVRFDAQGTEEDEVYMHALDNSYVRRVVLVI